MTVNAVAFSSDSCARNEAGNPALAEFDVSSGDAIAVSLPGLANAPELDPGGPLHDGPLHVVVFLRHEGIPVIGQLMPDGGGTPVARENVVCIATATGDEWFYSSVSLDGMAP
jgi:hypothetical protein